MVKKVIFFLGLILWSAGSIFYAAAELNFGEFKTHDNLTIRTAFWRSQGPKKGTVIFVQGMGEYIEGYSHFPTRLSEEGFDVLSFDWRCQGASDRMTKKPSLLHINSFDDYLKDLERFYFNSILNNSELSRPIILIGNSMGGHIALLFSHKFPKAIDKIIVLSPMIKIKTSPYPYPVARGIARVAHLIGKQESFVFGYDVFDYDYCLKKYEEKGPTSKKKYYFDCQFFQKDKDLALGGPSFGWLSSAFHSCDYLQRPEVFKNIKTPVLMVCGEHDHLVDTEAQDELCQSLPRCQLYRYEHSNHNLLKDEDEIFERLMTDILAFLS